MRKKKIIYSCKQRCRLHCREQLLVSMVQWTWTGEAYVIWKWHEKFPECNPHTGRATKDTRWSRFVFILQGNVRPHLQDTTVESSSWAPNVFWWREETRANAWRTRTLYTERSFFCLCVKSNSLYFLLHWLHWQETMNNKPIKSKM